jgi:hypothetical protein
MFTSSTKLFQSITPAGAAGYQIARSLRFNSADSAYLNRTPASAGNRKTWTWSGWVKRSTLGVTARIFQARVGNTGDQAFVQFTSGDLINISGSSGGYTLTTTQVFRDVSAFYHVLVAFDTTQATASNRIKLYVNGVQVTAFGTSTYPTQNLDTTVNSTNPHSISGETGGNTEYFPGYMADVRLIDGQALTPSSFGETDSATGVWVPKAYTGTYGTNGFWLKFDDNSGVTATTLGKDSSGNGNNWTPNNFSVTAGVGNDSLVDSPTNYGTDTGAGGEVRGNYATLNPLAGLTTGTLSNGNLDLVGSTSTDSMRHATIGIPSGKWYAEVTVNVASSSATMGLAVYGQSAVGTVNGTPSRGYYHTGQKYSNGTLATYGNSFTNGDVIGIAVDVSSGKIWFSKNGTWQASGDPAAGTNAAYTDLSTTETWFLTVQTGSSGTAPSCSWNFGQRPFAYTAPSGFKALNTQNLPTPAVGASASTLASKNFNIVLWTGNGATSRSITGYGFQPDFLWAKARSVSRSNNLYDAVRGVGKLLYSDTTAAESTNDSAGYISSFDSDGFTAVQGSSSILFFNENNTTYVGWGWKANGAGSSNNAGSIQSTVSVNTTAGISVVTYTGNGTAGATVGHGLGATPAMAIFKNRDAVQSWPVFHKSTTTQASGNVWDSSVVNIGSKSGGVLSLNLTAAAGAYNMDGQTNANTQKCVMYVFAEIAGFSKFGSYTGNGNADGPFVYCGFRPRYVMLKSSSNGAVSWWVLDSARNAYNLTDIGLFPNLSSGDNSSVTASDFLSNGFKIRSASNEVNQSTGTYIFAAFAESPFNYSRAR